MGIQGFVPRSKDAIILTLPRKLIDRVDDPNRETFWRLFLTRNKPFRPLEDLNHGFPNYESAYLAFKESFVETPFLSDLPYYEPEVDEVDEDADCDTSDDDDIGVESRDQDPWMLAIGADQEFAEGKLCSNRYT